MNSETQDDGRVFCTKSPEGSFVEVGDLLSLKVEPPPFAPVEFTARLRLDECIGSMSLSGYYALPIEQLSTLAVQASTHIASRLFKTKTFLGATDTEVGQAWDTFLNRFSTLQPTAAADLFLAEAMVYKKLPRGRPLPPQLPDAAELLLDIEIPVMYGTPFLWSVVLTTLIFLGAML